MSTQVQYRRGTATQNNSFVGALAEITVDTTNKTLRVHDGATAGGSNIATVAYVDNAIGSLSANSITDGTSNFTIVATNGNIRGNVGGSTITNIYSSGLAVTGLVSATTTITATGNVSGGNLTTVGAVTGNGRALTSLDASNLDTGTVPSARLSGTYTITVSGAATTAGTVTTAAQPNITSVGTLTSLTVTGNISGGNLSGTSIVGTLTTAAQTNITSVGTLTSLTSSGNIQGANLVATADVYTPEIVKSGSNGVGNIGQSTNTFNTVFAKATSAQYADLAEKYLADRAYAPGTVLEIGGTNEVTETTTFASTRIAGVVSTNPAFIMNNSENRDTAVEVALLGRVPCRVVGDVQKGDLLCSSQLPGVATALPANQFLPGSVIGKALENYSSTQEGTIEILAGRL